jgi:hypothetical protein
VDLVKAVYPRRMLSFSASRIQKRGVRFPMIKTHRGRHSLEHNVRHFVQRLVMDNAFRDRERAEKVNVLATSKIVEAASERFGEILLRDLPEVELGEVLVDSRREGSFQTPESAKTRFRKDA